MSKSCMSRPSFLVTLALLIGCSEDVERDEEPDAEVRRIDQEFRTGWHGSGHAEITRAGLGFLRDGVVSDLVVANEGVDGPAVCDDTSWIDWFSPECPATKLSSKYHFDNCRVAESFDSLRFRYTDALNALDPANANFDAALHRFGQILHTTQDFYAHSNWADAHSVRLVSEDGFLPPQVSPGSWLGDMVVLAKPMPVGWSVKRADGSRIPSVWDGQAWHDGLITGTYSGNDDPSICTPSGSIPHGDFNSEGWADQIADHDSYLAKDDPDSWHNREAVDLATDQTTEEFCRLVRLVSLRYGEPGSVALLDGWVADRAAYSAACPRDQSIVAALLMAAL